MSSIVYFVSSRVANNRGLVQRYEQLVDELGLGIVQRGDAVAIKTHFGDDGTTAFVHPQFARRVGEPRWSAEWSAPVGARKLVDRVKARGGHPFLTDTCTLYPGPRRHAVTHLELAVLSTGSAMPRWERH